MNLRSTEFMKNTNTNEFSPFSSSLSRSTRSQFEHDPSFASYRIREFIKKEMIEFCNEQLAKQKKEILELTNAQIASRKSCEFCGCLLLIVLLAILVPVVYYFHEDIFKNINIQQLHNLRNIGQITSKYEELEKYLHFDDQSKSIIVKGNLQVNGQIKNEDVATFQNLEIKNKAIVESLNVQSHGAFGSLGVQNSAKLEDLNVRNHAVFNGPVSSTGQALFEKSVIASSGIIVGGDITMNAGVIRTPEIECKQGLNVGSSINIARDLIVGNNIYSKKQISAEGGIEAQKVKVFEQIEAKNLVATDMKTTTLTVSKNLTTFGVISAEGKIYSKSDVIAGKNLVAAENVKAQNISAKDFSFENMKSLEDKVKFTTNIEVIGKVNSSVGLVTQGTLNAKGGLETSATLQFDKDITIKGNLRVMKDLDVEGDFRGDTISVLNGIISNSTIEISTLRSKPAIVTSNIVNFKTVKVLELIATETILSHKIIHAEKSIQVAPSLNADFEDNLGIYSYYGIYSSGNIKMKKGLFLGSMDDCSHGNCIGAMQYNNKTHNAEIFVNKKWYSILDVSQMAESLFLKKEWINGVEVFRLRNGQGADGCNYYRKRNFMNLKTGYYAILVPPESETEEWSEIIGFCDMDTEGGGWLVVQRRTSSDLDFCRNWNEYENGFSDSSKQNLWIGNKYLHLLTKKKKRELMVEINFPGIPNDSKIAINEDGKYYAVYENFSVDKECYRVHLKFKYGTMTDDLTNKETGAEGNIDGMCFTTIDRDNDNSELNCALYAGGGGFWYNNCLTSSLNGIYGVLGRDRAICWSSINEAGETQKIQKVEMKIR